MKRANTLRLPAILILGIGVLMLTVMSVPTFAWQSNEEGASEQEKQGYPVIVDGYVIFRVHQNLGVASAQERAARMSAGLQHQLQFAGTGTGRRPAHVSHHRLRRPMAHHS